MAEHHVCACYQRKLEEGAGSVGTGEMDAVNHHVGAGNGTLVHCKSTKCFVCLFVF